MKKTRDVVTYIHQRQRHAVAPACGWLLLLPPLWLSVASVTPAMAQGTAPVPAGAAAPATVPNVAPPLLTQPLPSKVNILILALDDLADLIRTGNVPVSNPNAVGGADQTLLQVPAVTPPVMPIPAPDGAGPAIIPEAPPANNAVPNEPVQPNAPQPNPAPNDVAPPPLLPAIRPTGATVKGGIGVETRAQAKKTPKDDAKDDAIFKMGPDNSSSYPLAKKTDLPPAPATADANSASIAAAPATPSLAPPVLPNSPFLTAVDPSIPRPPGMAQAAAAPLRRALLRDGFQDVLTTSPDGSTVERALNSQRLTPRVINSLEQATAQLVAASLNPAPPVAAATGDAAATPVTGGAPTATDPAVTRAAIQAASRIGQALGYRSVVVLGALPNADTLLPTTALPAAAPAPAKPAAATDRKITYSLVVVDAVRETGDVMVFDESGPSDLTVHETAAATSAAVVSKAVQNWPDVTEADKKLQAEKYMADARAAIAANNYAGAQDDLNQVLAFDANRVDAFLLIGDVMQALDPANAIDSYRKAADMKGNDGSLWAKVAVGYTIGPTPDWPRALEAGRKALALNYDSASLRQAMATAQLGRAKLFRDANRPERAEDAELEARRHLDRALELAPDDPGVTQLMTKQLVSAGRYRDAVRALDRIALQYPNDVDIQTQYATSLLQVGGRDEDAFVAWAKVWKLTGQQAVPIDAVQYRSLSEGFDQRLYSIGKRISQLTAGVAANTTSRESALLQITRYKEDMDTAIAAIKIIRPTFDAQGGAIHNSRIFAADLLSQSLEQHQLYLETGQEVYRSRANELYRQSIMTLNAARGAR